MPALKKRPIPRRKLSDAVFDQLVALIEEEGLGPGERLPAERDLMEAFGVGRPVVREAMQRLASMGMITIQHGERARVVQVDLDSVFNQIDVPARHLLSSSAQNVAHLHEARAFIEAGLARLAAERATEDDRRRLGEAYAEMRRKLGTDGFVDADKAFHLEMARISRNPILVAGCRAILQWMAEYRRHLLRAKGQPQTLDEHERILKRVVAHDAAGAEQAIRDHLDPTKDVPRDRPAGGRTRAASRGARRGEHSPTHTKERPE